MNPLSDSTSPVPNAGPNKGHRGRHRRRKQRQQAQADASYVCDRCGEEIVLPIDASAGESQHFTEDCPVCCFPNVIHVELDPDGGDPHVWAEREGS